MADGTNIKVSLEKAVHDALRELAQQLWDDHRLCLRRANFTWADASSFSDLKMIVEDVEVDTLTRL